MGCPMATATAVMETVGAWLWAMQMGSSLHHCCSMRSMRTRGARGTTSTRSSRQRAGVQQRGSQQQGRKRRHRGQAGKAAGRACRMFFALMAAVAAAVPQHGAQQVGLVVGGALTWLKDGR